MKTVVIGDLHGRSNWKLITHLEQPDRVIFIGDYFDSFNINGNDQLNNFLDIIEYKKKNKHEVILLIGNHDYHYYPEVGNVGTSGYQHIMAPSIEYVIDTNREHLQMAYQMDEYLFTHAGVSSEFMDNVFGINGWQVENIANDLNEMFKHKPLAFDFGSAANMKKFSYLDPSGDNQEQSPLWIRPKSLMRANKNTLRKQIIKREGKWEQRYEDEHSIEIWKYDTNKNPNGPVEVNITYKNGYDKQWDKMQKQAKNDRRQERQMRKINNKNKK